MPSAELKAALDAASAAAEVIRPLYRQPIRVDLKPDRSPVTEADLKAEQAIRKVLESRFPDYGIYGEEGGQHGERALNGSDPDHANPKAAFAHRIVLFNRGRVMAGNGGRSRLWFPSFGGRSPNRSLYPLSKAG